MRDHFEETGHKPTTRVVCQCGKRFSGGTSSGYRFHRFVFYYNVQCYHSREVSLLNFNVLLVFIESKDAEWYGFGSADPYLFDADPGW
jgi:hypothetical protein